MEHCQFTDDFPMKNLHFNGFSIAMLNNQMVTHINPVIVNVNNDYWITIVVTDGIKNWYEPH